MLLQACSGHKSALCSRFATERVLSGLRSAERALLSGFRQRSLGGFRQNALCWEVSDSALSFPFSTARARRFATERALLSDALSVVSDRTLCSPVCDRSVLCASPRSSPLGKTEWPNDRRRPLPNPPPARPHDPAKPPHFTSLQEFKTPPAIPPLLG